MKVLVIDTCGEIGSIALADSTAAAAFAAAILPGRTASERLLPAVRDLAAANETPLHSLGAIAVVHGPGSFTGVRVGVSAAKGLCEALEVPLVAISRLAVLSHAAEPAPGATVHAVLDAGRGEFYHAEYAAGVRLREALLTRDELFAVVQASAGSLVVVCEPAVAESLAALHPRLVAQPSAESALPLALRRIQQQEFDDVATLDANYLRRTDAEIFAKPKAAAIR